MTKQNLHRSRPAPVGSLAEAQIDRMPADVLLLVLFCFLHFLVLFMLLSPV